MRNPNDYKRMGERLAAFRATLLSRGGDAAPEHSDLSVCPLCVKYGCKHPPVIKQGRWTGLYYLTAGGLGCQHANSELFENLEPLRQTVAERWNEWCASHNKPSTKDHQPSTALGQQLSNALDKACPTVV